MIMQCTSEKQNENMNQMKLTKLFFKFVNGCGYVNLFSFVDALWVKVYNYSNDRSEQYLKQCNDEENIVKLWSI